MATIFYKADSRGYADHGWLRSAHTFSFAGYYNADRVHFGALRVFNDDYVAAGRGFGAHPHENMEIISIPLEGALAHQDSMGNSGTIRANEVQIMSAGSGITHSEFNGSETEAVKFLQIWLFSNKEDVTPRYDQISIDPTKLKNNLQQIISPNPDDEGSWIHQDAWFHLGNLDEGLEIAYDLKKDGDGLFVFVIEGQIEVDGQVLDRRDAVGLTDISKTNIKAIGQSSVLLIEVPMIK